MDFFKNFNHIHIDTLKEIGNIGLGRATTALSELLEQKIDVYVPAVNLTTFNEICKFTTDEEQVVFGIYFRVYGEAEGNLFFLLEEESAFNLLRKIDNPTDSSQLNEYELSILQEVGNILAGSYVSSFSDMTELKIQISPPSIQRDMVGAILSFGLLEYSIIGNEALVMNTHFVQNDNNIQGYFIFLPSPHSLTTIFKKLGVDL